MIYGLHVNYATIIRNLTSQEQSWLESMLMPFGQEEHLIVAETMGNGTIDSGDKLPCWNFNVDEDENTNLCIEACVGSKGEGINDNAVLAALLQRFLKEFRPHDFIVREWAHTCEHSCPDMFGGGAQIITADRVIEFETSQWIRNQIRRMNLDQQVCANK